MATRGYVEGYAMSDYDSTLFEVHDRNCLELDTHSLILSTRPRGCTTHRRLHNGSEAFRDRLCGFERCDTVRSHNPFDVSLEIKLGIRDRETRTAHLLAQVPICSENENPIGQGPCIAAFHDEAGLAVFHQFGYPSDSRSHHWLSERHRLGNHIPEDL